MDVQQSQGAHVTPLPVSSPVVPPVSPVQPPVPVAPIPPAPVAKKHSSLVFWIMGIVFIGLFIGMIAYFFLPKTELIIPDQVPSEFIRVNSLFLTDPAFLVIMRNSVEEGITLISNSTLLQPETYGSFDVPVPKDLLTPLSTGDLLYGALYKDVNNNEQFDDSIDKPLRDMLGREVKVYFHIL